ncbi:MAG TPA: C39 family peptidase [Candidatus Wallbacteria bacterium]|nr:C39 family peptidase [Candidatus Wallbacteria bacterium]
MKSKLMIISILLFAALLLSLEQSSAGITELGESLNSSNISQNSQTQAPNSSAAENTSTGAPASGVQNQAVSAQGASEQQSGSSVGYVEVNTWLNVRKGPGTNYERIGKLYRNDKVEILETQNGWHKIKWQGSTAWVCGRYVSKTELKDDDDSQTGSNPKNSSGNNQSNNGGSNNGTSGGNTGGQYQNTQAKDGVLAVPKRSQFSSENYANGIDYRNSWCGPNSFAMVLDYYGVHKSAYECAKLVEYTFKQRVGTPISGIVHGAQKAGFGGTQLYNGQSMDWLKSQVASGKPVIVNVDVKWQGHYIVVVGFQGNNVVVNDPGKGDVSRVQYSISKETFWSYWSSKGRGAVVVKK